MPNEIPYRTDQTLVELAPAQKKINMFVCKVAAWMMNMCESVVLFSKYIDVWRDDDDDDDNNGGSSDGGNSTESTIEIIVSLSQCKSCK